MQGSSIVEILQPECSQNRLEILEPDSFPAGRNVIRPISILFLEKEAELEWGLVKAGS